MTPDQGAVAAPILSGERAPHGVRAAVSWLFYLCLVAGVAHLSHTRVKPVASGPPASLQPRGALGESSGKPPSWVAKLDAVTKSDAAPAEISRRLRDRWPALPEEGQLEALRRIVNLVPDEDYDMVRDLAATGPLPAAAWEVLATDALTRPNSVNLPVLLEILVHGGDPARGEAKAELAAQLGADYGEDWAQWKAAIARKTSKSE
jgi:hypothetical protein